MENQSNASLPEHLANQVVNEPTVSVEPIKSFWGTLIRCNPFYLISAVLLLYGVYRASIDPAFFSTEARQVIFNFGSLELYGLMLVGTITLLARRKIWYDAALLYFIENVLVLVPFILISHAVVLDSNLARTLSVLGCGLVMLKFGMMKGLFTALNLPKRMLVLGGMILLVNAAIPLVFRKGLDLNNELWQLRSSYCWFLLLPLLAMAGHVMDRLSGRIDKVEEHRKPWIPLATFLLWMTGTAAHLYSVGYVDDQRFELAKFSVLAWAIAWLLCAKITLALSRFTPAAPVIMLIVPLLTPFLALGRPELAVTLNVLNAVIYGVLCLRWNAIRIPAVLGGISLVAAFLVMPDQWVTPVVKGYSKGAVIAALVAATIIIKAIHTREAKWGLFGAIVTGFLLLGLGENYRFSPHYSLQIGCTFLLVHSLFWKGAQERGSTVLVLLFGTLLCMDSFALARVEPNALRLLPVMTGIPVLVLAFLFRRAVVPMLAAGVSMLALPLSYAASVVQGAPTGILAVAASFVLFGLGTAFAIWKRRFPIGATGHKETSL
jgi:hypothetical protein